MVVIEADDASNNKNAVFYEVFVDLYLKSLPLLSELQGNDGAQVVDMINKIVAITSFINVSVKESLSKI